MLTSDGRDLPVIPPLPPGEPSIPDPNPPVAKCGECGLVLHQVMHYVCPSERCPVWLRAFCGASEAKDHPGQLTFSFARPTGED